MIVGSQSERITKLFDIKEKIMRKIIPYCFLFVLILAFASPTYSFDYIHRIDNQEEINAIYVSKTSRHSFPQKDYTYSFPVCDEKDENILNTIKVDAYVAYTIGTYSISIDYTDSDDPYVHRRTGYLVANDLQSTNDAKFHNLPVRMKDGKILFHSNSTYAPENLNSYYFEGDDINGDTDNSFKTNTYHMENSLLPRLYNNQAFFQRIKDKIPSDKTILGVCIKIYSSYDFCPPCRANILTLAPYFQNRFAKLLGVSGAPLPLTILGLNYRPYGHYYYYSKKGDIGPPPYGTDLFPQDIFETFNGTIHDDGSPQSILPIYLHVQPDKKKDEEKILTLKK
jgi:hypothetical protein